MKSRVGALLTTRMTAHPIRHDRARRTRPIIIFALGAIVVLGLFLRLYRLDELAQYLGDQGRDMLVVSHMLSTGEPALLGPGSGVGQFQRGPAYYYLLLTGLASTGGDPAGAAAAIAVLDAATILMLFVAGRLVGGYPVGLVAAALYATSGAVISLSRAFQNPNVLPFFSVLVFVSLALLLKNRMQFLPVLVAALVVAAQMHDHAWLLTLWTVGALLLLRPPLSRRIIAVALIAALLALLPFLVYELQNNLVNLRAIIAFVGAAAFRSDPGSGGVSLTQRLADTVNITQGFLPLSGAFHRLLVGALVASALLIYLQAWRTRRQQLVLLAFYTLLPLFYLVWPGPLYASYLAIVLPIPFLVLAFGIGWIMSRSRAAAMIMGAAVALICVVNTINVYDALARAVPNPESLRAARAAVEYMVARVPSRSFLWRIDKQQVVTHQVQEPWRYLLEWRGVSSAGTAVADGFAVYVPAASAPEAYAQAPVIAGNRIVHFSDASFGADVLRNDSLAQDVGEWSLRTMPQTDAGWDAAEGALRLRGDAMNGELMAVKRFNVRPETDYAIEYDVRGVLTRGGQRVYLICLDAARKGIAVLPNPGGYEPARSAEWRREFMWVRTPPNCVRAVLWLRQEGDGTSWFRNIRVRPLLWSKNDG